MLIHCPVCGERPFSEFVYGGDATITRPADPASTSDAEWHAYLYLRDNPRGLHRELWFHTAGCHAWLVVTRGIANHVITSVEFAKDAAKKREVVKEVIKEEIA